MFCLMSAVRLIGVKIWLVHLKALETRMRKLVLDLSLAQILPEKTNKMFLPKNHGFIILTSSVINLNCKPTDILCCWDCYPEEKSILFFTLTPDAFEKGAQKLSLLIFPKIDDHLIKHYYSKISKSACLAAI